MIDLIRAQNMRNMVTMSYVKKDKTVTVNHFTNINKTDLLTILDVGNPDRGLQHAHKYGSIKPVKGDLNPSPR